METSCEKCPGSNTQLRLITLNQCAEFPSDHLLNRDQGAISFQLFSFESKTKLKRSESCEGRGITVPKLESHWTVAIQKNYFIIKIKHLFTTMSHLLPTSCIKLWGSM